MTKTQRNRAKRLRKQRKSGKPKGPRTDLPKTYFEVGDQIWVSQRVDGTLMGTA